RRRVADVAGVIPAAGQGLLGRLVVVEVAEHDARRPDPHLALLAGRALPAVATGDLDLDAGHRAAARTVRRPAERAAGDDGRGLGDAVRLLVDRAAEPLLRSPHGRL